MKKGKNKLIAGLYFGISIVIIVALIIGNCVALSYKKVISVFFGQPMYTSEVTDNTNEDTEYFKSEFSTDEELYAASSELCEEVEAEGMVLLKNEDNCLPLGSGKTVSLFSESSVDIVYGGTGSGQIDTSSVPSLKEAFEAVGYSVNKTLWDFYSNNHSKYSRTTGEQDVYPTTFLINECPVSAYTDAVKASFADSDAAVIVLSRSGGEGADLVSTGSDGENGNYLALSQEEKDMIALANDNFDKIIVLVNSSNAIELGELENYANVKAILWIGGPGQSGLYAVPKVFTGEINPSGRLSDTYAYSSLSAPAASNTAYHEYTNVADFVSAYPTVSHPGTYALYNEGIYVGYRYYETRYEDVVLGQGNAGDYDYSSTVQFGFGFGLSYTTFEYSDYTVTEDDDAYNVSVTVRNTGDVAGKDVVQVYLQKPYTDYDVTNGIEKASVELAGFEKTDLIPAGGSESVTVTIDKESLKTYDENGEGTYIVEDGTYYFAIGNGAHDALNNILAAKGKTTSDGMDYDGNAALAQDVSVAKDFSTYSVSAATGEPIVNQLTDCSLNYYGITQTYVSRNDWEGTLASLSPEITATEQMLADYAYTTDAFEADPDDEMPVTGEDNGLTLQMYMTTDYDDAAWDDLVQQMTKDELYSFVAGGDFSTIIVDSVAAPGTVAKDGPQGLNTTFTGSVQAMAYTSEPVMASTFNKELIKRLGELVGEDGLHTNVQAWYAPGANIHRTPYSGRNFEYFSEDSYLSAIMLANEVTGAQSKGLICYAKHFAFNDQDCVRHGLSVWTNEQAAREIYLRAFEYAVRDSGCIGLMSSYSHVGSKWVGGNANIMENILRGEWGFEGSVISDFAGVDYMTINDGVMAGNDLWLAPNVDSLSSWQLYKGWESNPSVVKNLQRAAKNNLYTVSRSSSMNGFSSSTKVVSVTPAWIYWMAALDAVVGILFVVGAVLVIKKITKKEHD